MPLFVNNYGESFYKSHQNFVEQKTKGNVSHIRAMPVGDKKQIYEKMLNHFKTNKDLSSRELEIYEQIRNRFTELSNFYYSRSYYERSMMNGRPIIYPPLSSICPPLKSFQDYLEYKISILDSRQNQIKRELEEKQRQSSLDFFLEQCQLLSQGRNPPNYTKQPAFFLEQTALHEMLQQGLEVANKLTDKGADLYNQTYSFKLDTLSHMCKALHEGDILLYKKLRLQYWLYIQSVITFLGAKENFKSKEEFEERLHIHNPYIEWEFNPGSCLFSWSDYDKKFALSLKNDQLMIEYFNCDTGNTRLIPVPYKDGSLEEMIQSLTEHMPVLNDNEGFTIEHPSLVHCGSEISDHEVIGYWDTGDATVKLSSVPFLRYSMISKENSDRHYKSGYFKIEEGTVKEIFSRFSKYHVTLDKQNKPSFSTSDSPSPFQNIGDYCIGWEVDDKIITVFLEPHVKFTVKTNNQDEKDRYYYYTCPNKSFGDAINHYLTSKIGSGEKGELVVRDARCTIFKEWSGNDADIQLIAKDGHLMWDVFDKSSKTFFQFFVDNDFCNLGNYLEKLPEEKRKEFWKNHAQSVSDAYHDHLDVQINYESQARAVFFLNHLSLRDRLAYLNDFDVDRIKTGKDEIPRIFLKNISTTSIFDDRVKIDRDNWAITLINAGASYINENNIKLKGANIFEQMLDIPLKMAGHALIVFETVEDGRCCVKCGHLTKDDGVVFDSNCDGDKLKTIVSGKSETWLKPRYVAMEAIKKINAEVEAQKKGETPVNFNLLGRDSIFCKGIKSTGGSGEQGNAKNDANLPLNNTHNCTTWAVETLEKAGIPLAPAKWGKFISSAKEFTTQNSDVPHPFSESFLNPYKYLKKFKNNTQNLVVNTCKNTAANLHIKKQS